VLHRYKLTHKFFKNYFNSKVVSYFKLQRSLRLKSLKINAGLFKPAALLPEHSIILNNLAGAPTQFAFQFHGKRRRKTVALFAYLFNDHV